MESYVKVRKEIARKFYNQGFDVRLLPCKVSEQALYAKNAWVQAVIINKKDSEETKNAFDRTVNSYRYYNCQNAELGYYPHYYIEESVYNNQKGNVK